MSLPSRTTADRRTGLLYGCLGALLTSMLTCCCLVSFGVMPIFSGSVPPPPSMDLTRPDITIIVSETFIVRALGNALPPEMAGRATFDVQPGNRLVLQAKVNLLLIELDLRAVFRLAVENGELHLALERLDAAGQEWTEIFGSNADTLMQQIGRLMQQQIETGLGSGAQLMAIETDEQRLIIKARWER